MTDPISTADKERAEQLESLLLSAVEHHEAGRLEDARPIYEILVEALPRQPQILDLYGTLLHQCGYQSQAIRR